jgi:hypothetical protein
MKSPVLAPTMPVFHRESPGQFATPILLPSGGRGLHPCRVPLSGFSRPEDGAASAAVTINLARCGPRWATAERDGSEKHDLGALIAPQLLPPASSPRSCRPARPR